MDGLNKSLCYHFKLQSGLQMPHMLQLIKRETQVFSFSYSYLHSWQLDNKERLIIDYGNEEAEIKGFNLDALCPHLSNHTLLWLKEINNLEPDELGKYLRAADVLIISIKC